MAIPLNCDRVRDLIDAADDGSRTDGPDIRTHMESCPACRAYGQISRELAGAGRQSEKVDLWSRFRSQVLTANERPRFSYQWAGMIALAAVAVILTTGLIVNSVRKPVLAQTNAVASNSVVGTPVNSYDFESSDLDYYYEISMKF